MSESSSSKNLALFIEENTITYLTQSISENEYFYSEPVRFEIKQGLSTIEFDDLLIEIKKQLPLLLYYNSIKVVYNTFDFQIIPNAYLNNNDRSNIDFFEDQHFRINRLNHIDAKFTFRYYKNLNSVFNTLPNFKDAKYFHVGESLINKNLVHQELSQVFVRLINQNLELCIFKNGNFHLYNMFNQNSDEDVIYYVINTIQQLEINPATVEVIIDHGFTDNHKIFEYLPKFVKSVKVDAKTAGKDFKFLLNNLFECE